MKLFSNITGSSASSRSSRDDTNINRSFTEPPKTQKAQRKQTSEAFPKHSASSTSHSSRSVSPSRRYAARIVFDMWRRLKEAAQQFKDAASAEIRENISLLRQKNDVQVAFVENNKTCTHKVDAVRVKVKHPSAANTAVNLPAEHNYFCGKLPAESTDGSFLEHTKFLVQGIVSGKGTFQFVSRKAHFRPAESSDKPLIGSLQEQWRIHQENGTPLVLGGRFEVIYINPARPREPLAHSREPREEEMRCECQLKVIDLQDSNREIRTIPLTQVGLKFTDKCLKADQIVQAHKILKDHQKRCASLQTLPNSERQALPMIASHAGRGRGPTLIAYSDIVEQIEAGLITDEIGLNKALIDVIDNGRKTRITADILHSREPDLNGFVHSERQLGELKQALDKYLKNKIPAEGTFSGGVGTRHEANHASVVDTPVAAAKSGGEDFHSAATRQDPIPVTDAVSSSVPQDTEPNQPASQSSPAPASMVSTGQQKVVDFFNNGPSNDNRLCIRDVIEFNDDQLEQNHQFIQYLFPTDTASAYNSTAPVLTGDAILALRDKHAIHDGLDAGLKKMLKFYGLEENASEIRIRFGKQRRVGEWLYRDSHHCLRMTRMLRSLTLFGKNEQAAKLNAFLQKAVQQLPASTGVQMKSSLLLWEKALVTPLPVSAKPSLCTTLLFPNKRLGSALMATASTPTQPNCEVKAALFKKQEEIFADLSPGHTKAPLIAHFSKPEFIARYEQAQHFDELVNDNAQQCAVTVCDSYYFAQKSGRSAQGNPSATSINDVYKIHVDFANQAFGGAWKQRHGYAQEEIAFLENTGLGAVAQHAQQVRRSPQAADIQLDQRKNFGDAFSTRINNTPSPILIEGCVRAAQFGSYGAAASNLPVAKALEALTPDQPQTTNWLAIAAPDLRFRSGPLKTPAAQFDDIFSTAHAGFCMSKALAGDKTVEIHTGQFGCGVFNNDVTFSTAAQILAAKLAGINNVRFHGYRMDDKAVASFNAVNQTIEACIANSLTTTPRENIRSLVSSVFQTIEFKRGSGESIPRGV